MKIEKDCELFIKTIELGFESEADRQEYFDNKIHHNKIHSRISAKARRNSKLSYCYFCKTKCSGFCKSHSIPEFVLTNIAKNGMVRYTLEAMCRHSINLLVLHVQEHFSSYAMSATANCSKIMNTQTFIRNHFPPWH